MSTSARAPGASAPTAMPSFASSAELRPGALVHYGKYRIGEVLGRGSFAVVYAAEHVALKRPVAIKVVHVTPETSRSLITRFQREAQTSALVCHPNVLETHDSGALSDGSPFLVVERVEGRTLAALLAQGPLDIATAVDIGRQLARALVAIDEAGIVHRDLKPDNVMLHRLREGALQVKLVDFGVSKRPASQAVGLTAQGELIGTPQYMAPEQLRGEDIDARADIYALGALLYEVVTGRAPHERENLGDLMVAVLNEPVRPPRELRPECPPALEDVLLCALERARERRFASPAALLMALDRIEPHEVEPSAPAPRSAAGAAPPPTPDAPPVADVEHPSAPDAHHGDEAERWPAPPRQAQPSHASGSEPLRRADRRRPLALGAAAGLALLALVFALVAPSTPDQTPSPAEPPARVLSDVPTPPATSAAEPLPRRATGEEPTAAASGSGSASTSTSVRTAEEPRVRAAAAPVTSKKPGAPAAPEEVAKRAPADARRTQRSAAAKQTESAGSTRDKSADRQASHGAPASNSQPTAAPPASERAEKPSPALPAETETETETAKPTPAALARWQATMRRALGLLARGDAAKARVMYRQATEIIPTRAAGYRGLALAAARAGEGAEAERALARYRELAPDAADASSIAARISSISSP